MLDKGKIIVSILAILNFLVAADAAIASAAAGCTDGDHRSCDDVCKSDSYWYGYCAVWNGRDLQCSCVQYQRPLDGQMCARMQAPCAQRCRAKGQEGGYCAVFPSSSNDPRGEPKCMCFEKPALF